MRANKEHSQKRSKKDRCAPDIESQQSRLKQCDSGYIHVLSVMTKRLTILPFIKKRLPCVWPGHFFFWYFFNCKFIIFKIYLSIYGCIESSLRCAGFSLQWLLLLRSMGSRRTGLSSCSSRVSRAQAQQLWRTGLVAPQHVGSSQTRARTCVPCTGRRILDYGTTREVPGLNIYVHVTQLKNMLTKLLCALLPGTAQNFTPELTYS